MIAYHVDRWNSLVEGQVIELQKPPEIYPHKEELLSLFPDGISMFGKKILINHLNSEQIIKESVRESIFEYERRLNFPNRFSRFQSLFASISYDKSHEWYSKLPSTNTPILWEIDVDPTRCCSLDSSWLYMGMDNPSPLLSMSCANSYWSGKINDNPEFEILVYPPIKVLRRIL